MLGLDWGVARNRLHGDSIISELARCSTDVRTILDMNTHSVINKLARGNRDHFAGFAPSLEKPIRAGWFFLYFFSSFQQLFLFLIKNYFVLMSHNTFQNLQSVSLV